MNHRTAAGLSLQSADDPADALLQVFYEGYDRAFVIEAEKEPLAGFVECLALNRSPQGQGLALRYGPFRELVVVAREDARIVGGANLTCLRFAGRAGLLLTVSLNYLYVLPDFRRRGFSRDILLGCAALAQQVLGGPLPLVFLEQHDPLRVSADDDQRDSERAGIDQRDRLRVWSRCGAWIVDFDYVQPPLAPGAEAADNLLLSVCAAPATSIDACTVAGHLERFFAIACLKGRLLDDEPVAARQVAQLKAACAERRSLPLLDPQPWLDDPLAPSSGRPASLRDALRRR